MKCYSHAAAPKLRFVSVNMSLNSRAICQLRSEEDIAVRFQSAGSLPDCLTLGCSVCLGSMSFFSIITVMEFVDVSYHSQLIGNKFLLSALPNDTKNLFGHQQLHLWKSCVMLVESLKMQLS